MGDVPPSAQSDREMLELQLRRTDLALEMESGRLREAVAERDRYESICKDYDAVLHEYEVDLTNDLALRTLVGFLRHQVNMRGMERRRRRSGE